MIPFGPRTRAHEALVLVTKQVEAMGKQFPIFDKPEIVWTDEGDWSISYTAKGNSFILIPEQPIGRTFTTLCVGHCRMDVIRTGQIIDEHVKLASERLHTT